MEETLFGDVHVSTRKGAVDYLTHLNSLRYHDDLRPAGTWTFWALAPIEKRWTGPRAQLIISDVEYVWLTDGQSLYQAQIEIATGTIRRRRPYQPTEAL